MYGCTDIGQLLGKSPADFSPSTQPNGKPSVEFSRGLIRETLKGTPQYFEWEHKTLQGKLLWTEVVLNRIVLKGKYFIQAIIRDISEKKKITEAHRLVELGKLVSNMAHEVNNPLMIISGNAQLVAQMDDISNAKAQEKLEIISDQCKRAKTIIQR
jgi:signal transduction histidine kinase